MVTTPTVAIGWIDGGTTHGGFTEWVGLVGGRHPDWGTLRVQSPPNLAKGRNDLVRLFLETDHEWLMMVDSDMVPPLDGVERLLEGAFPGERPIMGGLCFTRDRSGYGATMYLLGENRDLTRIENFVQTSHYRVHATGAAFLIVHRDAFEKIAELRPDSKTPWFEETVNEETGNPYGEDITFCLRAGEADLKVYVDPTVWIGHIKPVVVNLPWYENWVEHHRLVVTGTPRSGTAYVSTLLGAAGVATGHETVYRHKDRADWHYYRAEVSWMAVPFLGGFHGQVLHLRRNPMDVLNSLMGIGFFHQRKAHSNWIEFIAETAPWLELPDDPLAAGQQFIMGWNRAIEQYATARVKVEEIRDDWMKLGWMLAAVDAQPTQPWVEGILAAVPTDVNKRHRAKVQPADTKPAFRKFIREYEY